MKARTWAESPAETVVLIEIHDRQDISRHGARLCCVERNDERDGDILLVELICGLDRRVRAKRMPDKNHDVPLTSRISVSDLPNRWTPAIGTVNARAIASSVEPGRKGIHPAGKNVGESAEKINPYVRCGRSRLRASLSRCDTTADPDCCRRAESTNCSG
jgi:hypothetical protein